MDLLIRKRELGITREKACISYFRRNLNVLRELLDKCSRHYLGLIENKTCVFEHEGDRWKSSKLRNKRDMLTVVIDRKLKEMLLGDVVEFLDFKTRTWYFTKSSFSLFIIGQFDLDVYVLTMFSLNDYSLKTFFTELPQHCIVLLEDVDITGVNRTKNSSADVSLLTLFNVLDGLASPEGRVLIMTTNYIERLDPALIRPGRVDTKVEFRFADEDMIS
ncbi:hypothetical protein K469DRAFT_724408 [Zopfia rhizophila CBS 207.26]|uniref:ATPase AAA-type core domain-containing protein n=1 Tax=Zopfia rhizophila CBS 207.26 TaxID=1314779 RepID=A0A6A6D6W8_9PEZI|nr:hypothetical protein K469DRAFT_724408 [Zopfia rhizophila CBS 207.26]